MLALVVAFALSQPSSLESFSIDGVDVDVFTPSTSKIVGDVLVLPGWDSTRQNWCSGGRGLCDEAEKRGLRLVMPEMGRSVYAWDVYAETKAVFRTPPTRRVLEHVIADLQHERGLLADPRATFVLGRSTGARGAVLLVEDHPEWFRAAAGLSGDYDQTTMPTDGLMEGAYGLFATFPDRWRGRDNPTTRAANGDLVTPLYLGHGAKDPTVPPAQTTTFAAKVGALATLHVDAGGKHDHGYWKSELTRVFDFFAASPDNVAAVDVVWKRIASLAGTFTAKEPGIADSQATFSVDAKGTAVVQRSGFLAVFAKDGASITCHAWVDDGFSAHLRAVPDAKGALVFRVVDVETSLLATPAAPHARGAPVDGMTLTFDPLVETWRFPGSPPLPITFTRH